MAALTRTRIRKTCRHWVFPLSLLMAAGASHGEATFTGSGASISGDMAIDAAQGVVRGGNVFHSFSVFNIGRLESAVFTGPVDIRNVISRVTGTGSSLIDGPLSVAIPGANFFFINPNGVMFGAGASINVDGSAYFSTANSLRLADGGVFHADAAKASVLTSAEPVAFGFLSANPAPISVDGAQLFSPVPPGKTFALVGGHIDIHAGEFGLALIVAPSATVNLASVASAGDAILGTGAVDVSGFETLGNIQLSGTYIDVGGDPGGSIYIRGNQLGLTGAGLLSQSFGDADGGVVDIGLRGDMQVKGDAQTGDISLILVGSYGGFGKGATINLDVGGKLAISDSSFVISESHGPGAAGNIRIRAGAIEIQGQGPETFTGISAENYDVAAGPSLSIVTGSLSLLNGGFIGTRNFGPGTGGALTIDADSILATGATHPDTGVGGVTLSLSTETLGGPAGNMTIRTRTLDLRDGARISSSTGGPGQAGDLDIAASERVDIDGGLSGIFTATAPGANGYAGSLRVSAPLLSMNGGVIDSTTVGDGNAGAIDVSVGSLQLRGGAQIRSFSGGFDEDNNDALVVGSGNAGNVSVVASGLVDISGSAPGRPSGLLAETRGSGAGGDVQVQARVLNLHDGATISSSSLGSGLAGNIEIQLADSLDIQGGIIATRALTSDGGNISIVAPRLIRLVDGQITTSVQSGVGGGGNIFIDPQFVLLQNSQIIANAFGGPGGNIRIVAGQLISDPATIISASSTLGIDGSVNIDAPDTDVSASLAVLPASFLDAASLMRAGCSAARAGLSSLVQVGRGGLPPDPGDYLPSMGLGALARGAVVASRVNTVPSQHALGQLASLHISDCSP